MRGKLSKSFVFSPIASITSFFFRFKGLTFASFRCPFPLFIFGLKQAGLKEVEEDV